MSESYGTFGDDYVNLKEHLDMRIVVLDLLRSINAAAAENDEVRFESLIHRLRDSLPREKRIEVEDEREDYEYDNSHWENVKMDGEVYEATPEAPLVTNEKGTLHHSPDFMGIRYEFEKNEEGDYINVRKVPEKGGIHWISPRWVPETGKVDYRALLVRVCEKFEELGYLYRTSSAVEEHGFTDNERKKRRTPTPPPQLEEDEADE